MTAKNKQATMMTSNKDWKANMDGNSDSIQQKLVDQMISEKNAMAEEIRQLRLDLQNSRDYAFRLEMQNAQLKVSAENLADSVERYLRR